MLDVWVHMHICSRYLSVCSFNCISMHAMLCCYLAVSYWHFSTEFLWWKQTCLCTGCLRYSIQNSSLCLFQGEGPDGSGPSWLPGRAGHPVAVGRWRTSTTDHQPGHQLCLWPVSLQMHDSPSVSWSTCPSVWLFMCLCEVYMTKAFFHYLSMVLIGSIVSLHSGQQSLLQTML